MKPTVVVGYDQSPSADKALVAAAREAAWRGASLSVVTAYHWTRTIRPTVYMPLGLEEAVRDAAEKVAAHGADLARSRFPGMTVAAKAVAGPAPAVLAGAAHGAELLVLGDRGLGGFADLLLGSVPMRTLAEASGPTMVVRGSVRDPHDVVLAAVGLDEPADAVLDFAFAEAARRSAHLTAVTAWDASDAIANIGATSEVQRAAAQATADIDKALEESVRTWHVKYPQVRVSHRVADGVPSAVLTEATKHADLIVVGARRSADAHHGDTRIGPVAHAVLYHADCPVAVVPHG